MSECNTQLHNSFEMLFLGKYTKREVNGDEVNIFINKNIPHPTDLTISDNNTNIKAVHHLLNNSSSLFADEMRIRL